MQLRAHMKVKTKHLLVFPALLGDFRKNWSQCYKGSFPGKVSSEQLMCHH